MHSDSFIKTKFEQNFMQINGTKAKIEAQNFSYFSWETVRYFIENFELLIRYL